MALGDNASQSLQSVVLASLFNYGLYGQVSFLNTVLLVVELPDPGTDFLKFLDKFSQTKWFI